MSAAPRSLRDCRTLEIWNALPSILFRSLLQGRTGRRPGPRTSARLSGTPVGYWPPTYQEVAAEAAYYYNRADAALRGAGIAIREYADGNTSRNHVSQWLNWARSELNKTREEVWREGARDAGDALEILSERMANAARNLGKGGGDAFRAFWGMPPLAVFGSAAVLAVIGLGFAGTVILSGTLGPIGAGAGKAISRVPALIPKLTKFSYGG